MKYNISEIIEIAIRIEKSGFEFYSKAAKLVPEESDFFTFLANEEITHDFKFNAIKKELNSSDYDSSIYDPDGIISVYFDSIAKSTIFKSLDQIEEIFQNKSTEDIIDWAIEREHHTILFFSGLKTALVRSEYNLTLDKLISEEINHVHLLMDKKSKILK